jgi:hypothetical protein
VPKYDGSAYNTLRGADIYRPTVNHAGPPTPASPTGMTSLSSHVLATCVFETKNRNGYEGNATGCSICSLYPQLQIILTVTQGPL